MTNDGKSWEKLEARSSKLEGFAAYYARSSKLEAGRVRGIYARSWEKLEARSSKLEGFAAYMLEAGKSSKLEAESSKDSQHIRSKIEAVIRN